MNLKAKVLQIVFALTAACLTAPAFAAGGGIPLDRFPTDKLNDVPGMQEGAKIFVNYCMGCHSVKSMRYNRMRDIGLTEDQIKANLLFTDSKVGETMTIPMRPADAKEWFGALPPDLSVTARSRSSHVGSGSDWMYTFLRSFYRDADRPTGWNNALFPSVGMPHVLWPLQGQRGATVTDLKDTGHAGHGAQTLKKIVTTYDAMGFPKVETGELKDTHLHAGTSYAFGDASGGQLNSLDYDDAAANLVAFLTYVSDPSAKKRKNLGVWVLVFLGLFFWAAWALNKAFWRDIK